MASAALSMVYKQLVEVMAREAELEVRLVIGVEKDVEKLLSTFRTLQAAIMDAEQRRVTESRVGVWLDKLQDACYDMEDAMDEWNYSILKRNIEEVGKNAFTPKNKVRFKIPSPCICFKQKVLLRLDIAIKIKELSEKFDDIAKEEEMYNFDVTKNMEEPKYIPSPYSIHVSVIAGRDEEKNTLVNKLLSEGSEEGLHVISLVGKGGIGKTTLARLAYNNSEVIKSYDKRVWVCVSELVDNVRIARAIIEGLDDLAPNVVEFNSLLKQISNAIKKKKFLVILDDLWTDENDKWEPFFDCLKNGIHGSKILVTTRNDRIAAMIRSDVIPVTELSDDDCWLLFKRLAFHDRSLAECEKLAEIGRKIVGKCMGLPLAVNTLGNLLRFKKTMAEWQSILDSQTWKLELEKGLLPPLLLSYNDLPSMVKQCFLYCGIFPKDYSIKKNELIRLWMAQGYLGLEEDKGLEEIGDEYFDILATRSFFQEFVKDRDGNNIRCKMHDIVHEFAQHLTQNKCCTIEVNGHEDARMHSSYEKARHAMILLRGKASFPVSYNKPKALHSLLVDSSGLEDSVSMSQIVNQLTCLRALRWQTNDYSLNSNIHIPVEIGKLIHLRYLEFSRNYQLKELPETICELYNLQTLDVSFCYNLEKLPHGIGKLINLRHLINVLTLKLSHMPRGIERLTYLKTLSKFVVSDSSHAEEACTLESLKYFKHLQSLRIEKLGNLTDPNVAKKVELKKWTKINSLCLDFGKSNEQEEGTRTNEDDELLLEALRLPPNVQTLEIYKYRGNFISLIWLVSLTKLTKLYLGCYINLESLPPLGILPSLESLDFWGMKRVKSVGKEMLCIESGIGTKSSSSVTVFPKLTSLSFFHFPELQEWNYEMTWKERGIKIMPCLELLVIVGCPRLKALPDHLFQTTTLKKLEIRDCPLLYSYLKRRGQHWPKNFHIPEIKITLKDEHSDSWRDYTCVIDQKEHKFAFRHIQEDKGASSLLVCCS